MPGGSAPKLSRLSQLTCPANGACFRVSLLFAVLMIVLAVPYWLSEAGPQNLWGSLQGGASGAVWLSGRTLGFFTRSSNSTGSAEGVFEQHAAKSSSPPYNFVFRKSASEPDLAAVPTFPLNLTAGDEEDQAHNLLLYRANLIPYELHFPGVLAARAGAAHQRKWAIRFLAMFHLQSEREDPKEQFQKGCSYKWVDFEVQIKFRLGSRVEEQSAERTSDQWSSKCASYVDGFSSLTLFVECPLPDGSWPSIETATFETVIYLDIAYVEKATGREEQLVSDLLMIAEPVAAQPYNWALCMGPLYGHFQKSDRKRLVEYMEYSRLAIGLDHVFVYNYYNVKDPVFVHYERLGLLTYVEWPTRIPVSTRNQSNYLYDQGLIYNDCLMRNKFQARWLAFIDLDEYLLVPPLAGSEDRASLISLLDGPFAHVAQIILSSTMFSTRVVANASTQLLLEQRQYRTKRRDNDWAMKSIVSPMKCKSFWIHFTKHFEEPPPGVVGYSSDFYAPMDLAFVGHYRTVTHVNDWDDLIVDEPTRNVARWASQVESQVAQTLDSIV